MWTLINRSKDNDEILKWCLFTKMRPFKFVCNGLPNTNDQTTAINDCGHVFPSALFLSAALLDELL